MEPTSEHGSFLANPSSLNLNSQITEDGMHHKLPSGGALFLNLVLERQGIAVSTRLDCDFLQENQEIKALVITKVERRRRTTN